MADEPLDDRKGWGGYRPGAGRPRKIKPEPASLGAAATTPPPEQPRQAQQLLPPTTPAPRFRPHIPRPPGLRENENRRRIGASGPSELEAMNLDMRFHLGQATKYQQQLKAVQDADPKLDPDIRREAQEAADGRRREFYKLIEYHLGKAADRACDIAPYNSPKLAAVRHMHRLTETFDLGHLTDEELSVFRDLSDKARLVNGGPDNGRPDDGMADGDSRPAGLSG